MNYKCEKCLDTGSIKGELYLDCTSCDVAKERADLHAYLAKNQFMHPHELAWLVHQRALAMAPKQERRPVHEENARHAIDAAILFGRNGTNKPPTDDHWLMQYWNMGVQLAMAPKQEAPTQGPISWLCTDLDGHCDVGTTKEIAKKRAGHSCNHFIPLFDNAAPAVANGALKDEQIGQMWKDLGGDNYPAATRFARAILAAAGPDAALIDERVAFEAKYGPKDAFAWRNADDTYKVASLQMAWEIWQARAALSGAKGN